MSATQKQSAPPVVKRGRKLELSPGYSVKLTREVPPNHRVPGFSHVVVGPLCWGLGTGEGIGSYGSGHSPEDATRNAYRIWKREERNA